MMIMGYKAFDSKTNNRYGMHFEESKVYKVDGEVKFGTCGNGYHMCSRLEDTLRYVDTNDDFVIAEVIGFGDMVLSEDEYNGYYDMYAVRNIYIKKILSRDEIIKMMLNVNENRAFRFVQFYPLSDEEKEMFKLGYAFSEKVLDGIRYYQEGDKDVYSRKSPSYVKKIGENNG